MRVPAVLRALLRRPPDAEVDEELRFHIEREIEERIRRGVEPNEARRSTLRDFGGVTRYAEEVRETRPSMPVEQLVQDIRYGMRTLGRAPGFAVVAIATLALGIGATTSVFSAVDGVLLKPLPYADADRVVVVWQHDRAKNLDVESSPATFLDWRERSRSFAHLAAAEPYSFDLMTAVGPESIRTWLVSEHFFEAMGTRPLLGRTIRAEEHVSGRAGVVVLSHRLWVARFGADPSVVGRAYTFDRTPMTIVGVMPPQFAFPSDRADEAGLWAPRVFDAEDRTNRTSTYLPVVGRLRPGVALAEAEAELDAISLQLEREYPRTNANVEATLAPLEQQIVGRVRPGLLVLLVAVGLVLLVACANLANLLLARAASRERELAVRVALGASRSRVLRQLLTESALVAIAGGVAGIAMAYWGVQAIRALGPAEMPRIEEIALDARAVAFALVASLGTVVLFGLLPALRASRPRIHDALRAGARGVAGDRGRRRARAALVGAEVALSLVLLIGAGLLVRSLVTLLAVDRGYRVEGVLASSVQAWGDYPKPEQKVAYVRDVLARLAVLPGVTAVGTASSLPLAEPIGRDFASYVVAGEAKPADGEQPTSRATLVAGDFFAVLGIPLRAGRRFTAADDATSPPVVLVNESFARRHWPGESAIGRRITVSFIGKPVEREVVGVVGDVRHAGLDDAPVPGIYLPHAQSPNGAITFVVRTEGDAAALLPAVRSALFEINPTMPLYATATMEALLADSLRARRFILTLLGCFSVAALVLAAVGVYGVMSQVTGERTREIGVRMALGAQPGEVLRMVMRQGAGLAVGGIVVGVAGAAVATRVLGSMLYEVRPLDPLTFAAVPVVVLLVAVLATFVPAWRATRIDPLGALRAD